MAYKKKHKTINQVVDRFDTMQELASGLNSSIFNIYAGYLRQPISHDLVIGDQYIIHGICALNQENCSYMVSANSVKCCDTCDVYKTRFGGTNGNII